MRDLIPANVVRNIADAWKLKAQARREVTPVDGAADAMERCALELEQELKAALEDNQLVTVVNYAHLHGVDPATVRRWCVDGKLPGAEKNAAGDWLIPIHAQRQRKSA